MSSNLQDLFLNLLDNTDTVRENSKNSLIEYSKNYPNEFLDQSFQIYENINNQAELRNTVLITLNNLINLNQKENDISLYLWVSTEKRLVFKNKIMNYLKNENNKILKKSISNLIGDFSSSLFSKNELEKYGIQNNDKWPSLKNELIEVYKSGEEENILGVLKIMSWIINAAAENFLDNISEIYYLIQNSLGFKNVEIKNSAIELFITVIESIEPNESKVFKNLMKDILINYKIILDSGDDLLNLDATNFIIDLIEAEPSFFSQYIDDLFMLAQMIVENKNVDNSTGLKNLMIEMVLKLFERYKTKFKRDDKYINNTILMILLNMSQIDNEIEKEWTHPETGDMYDEVDIIIKDSLDFIYSLLEIFGKEFILKRLSLNIEKFIDNNNWKSVYSSLMSLSQIGEFINNDIKSVEPILILIGNYINNENPKIRYACLNILSKYSNELSPDFEELYISQFMKLIENRINDPIPRVLSKCLDALTNFIEHLNYELKKDYFMSFFNKLVEYLNIDSIIVQETSLSCLFMLIQDGRNLTISIEQQLMQILYKIVKDLKGSNYKIFRSLALECITVLFSEIKKENFNKYINEFIEIIVHIQINAISNGEDSIKDVDHNNFDKTYVLRSWKRLIRIAGDNCIIYLDKIIPALINKSLTKSKNSNKFVLSYDDQEALEAIETLKIFLKKLGNHLIPYLENIYLLIINLMEFMSNEQIRTNAIELLIPFIKVLKNNNNLNNDMIKKILGKILLIMDNEDDPETLTKQGYVVKEIFNQNSNFLNQIELKDFYEKFISFLKKSDQRKIENRKMKTVDDEEDKKEVEECIENDNLVEEEWGCCIADIFGKIFKSHKNSSLFIAEKLYLDYIETTINPKNRPKIIKFGLFLIDDMIDFLGEFLPLDKLNLFWKILSNYSNHPDLEVRHAAVYGLGSFSYQVKEYPYAKETLELLYKSYSTPLEKYLTEEDFEEEDYLVFKDNATSAFGKIIKKFSNQFNQNDLTNWINFWYKNMPIIYDEEESTIQNEFFCELLDKNPKLINSENNENFNLTIKKLLLIYNKKKISNEKINNFISQYIKLNKDMIMNFNNFTERENHNLKKIFN